MLKRRIPYISQLGSMDCGIACLTMMFNYYGIKSDIVDVGMSVEIGRDGVSLSVLKKISEKYGFDFSAYHYEYVQKNLDSILPVILFSGSHYVVIEKKKRNQYIIIDPAKGRVMLGFDAIVNLYKDICISIVPSKKLVNTEEKSKYDIPVKRFSLLIATVLMVVMQLIILAVPLIIQQLIDGVVEQKILNINYCVPVIALITIAFFMISWIRHRLVLNINMDLYKNLISSMLNKVFNVDINFFEWHSTGDVANRFNSINQLIELISNGLSNIIVQVITSIACLFVMAFLSVKLTIATVVMAIMQLVLMIVINESGLIRTKKYMYKQSVIQSHLVETLDNMLEIECMGMGTTLSSSLKEEYDNLIVELKKKTYFSNLMNCFVSTVGLIFPLLLYIIGSYSILSDELSMGSLISFVALAGYFISPFSGVVILLPSINSVREIMLRYKELICFREKKNCGIKVEEPLRNISVENVAYFYTGVESSAIQNISLQIEKGESIAFVGTSGSGKSTLIKSILGAVAVNAGNIYINNININQISKEQIYNWFSVVTQNPLCLNGSIRKNIDVTGKYADKEIWNVLGMAEVRNDIEQMKLGLDTIIGEGGQNISGGQRQRIAIARALINDNEVVIFDEATSNLDPITERKIYENLKRCGKTRITITHRLASIQDVDTIYVLEKGRIIEKGMHGDLIQQKGWYYMNFQN